MNYEGTLKFEEHNIEFINPTIEILEDGVIMYKSKGEISAPVIIQRDGVEYRVNLENVKVNNFNADEEGTLELRVMDRLKDFEAQ